MDLKIFQKYRESYGVRFSRKQKRAVREALTEDFESLGYRTHSIRKRTLLHHADNLLFGNIHHARTIIVVPYDTPQRVFWRVNRYYPLNGTLTLNKGILPLLVPVVVIYIALFGCLQLGEHWAQEANQIRMLSIFMLGLLAVLIYWLAHGFANRHNDNRYTAAIAAAMEVAQGLDKDQRRQTVFLFLDGNHGRFYGAKLAAEAFQNEHKNPNIIVLSTFAKGSKMIIGYRSKGKKTALELHHLSESIKTMKVAAMSDAMWMSTLLEHFPKAVMIAAGEVDAKGQLCVMDTATPKDRHIDIENVDALIALLQAYIKKQQ